MHSFFVGYGSYVNCKIRHKIIVSILISLLVILVLVPIIYVQANKIIYANRVTDYLLEEENYNEEELQSVKGIWGVKLPPFYAVVTFQDEPYVEYIYFAHNDVMQFSYKIKEEGIEKGVTKSKLKHYVDL